MAYSAEDQAKIDAAHSRNEAAKTAWANAVAYWNTNFVNLKCYGGEKHNVYAAATWFTPNDNSCNAGAGCTSGDKQFCKSKIADIIGRLGNVRGAYSEFTAAQANYDQVLADVVELNANDPVNVFNLAKLEADARVAAAARRQQYIFYGIAIVVIGFLVFAYFKWFRK